MWSRVLGSIGPGGPAWAYPKAGPKQYASAWLGSRPEPMSKIMFTI